LWVFPLQPLLGTFWEPSFYLHWYSFLILTIL
jgi:hypothetical protein